MVRKIHGYQNKSVLIQLDFRKKIKKEEEEEEWEENLDDIPNVSFC